MQRFIQTRKKRCQRQTRTLFTLDFRMEPHHDTRCLLYLANASFPIYLFKVNSMKKSVIFAAIVLVCAGAGASAQSNPYNVQGGDSIDGMHRPGFCGGSNS